MKNTLVVICAFFMAVAVNAQKNAIEGRWDLVLEMNGKEHPSWLEVSHSGMSTFVGRYVFLNGSARPISEVNIKGDAFSFSIPPQWESGDNLEFKGQLVDEKLKGSFKYTDGKTYTFTGVRAPKLTYNANPKWGEPITLFNGKDLTGWKAMGENQWIVEDGVLISPKSGANLVSETKYKDFKLHIEFKYPAHSNSGIYLRGRYEVQVEDSSGEPSSVLFGGVYGFLTPNEMAAKGPDVWQQYDITLIGNRVTIVANGKTIISDQIIPGITGGALDSNEGEPGPFLIQGDHGPVSYRNIIVTPVLD